MQAYTVCVLTCLPRSNPYPPISSVHVQYTDPCIRFGDYDGVQRLSTIDVCLIPTMPKGALSLSLVQTIPFLVLSKIEATVRVQHVRVILWIDECFQDTNNFELCQKESHSSILAIFYYIYSPHDQDTHEFVHEYPQGSTLSSINVKYLLTSNKNNQPLKCGTSRTHIFSVQREPSCLHKSDREHLESVSILTMRFGLIVVGFSGQH